MKHIIYALTQDIYCQIAKLDISKYSVMITNIVQAYTNYTLFPRQLNNTTNSKNTIPQRSDVKSVSSKRRPKITKDSHFASGGLTSNQP